LEAAERWCERKGLVLAGHEVDPGVSAYHGRNFDENSALNRLLKQMHEGDTLLFEDNDRFSRLDVLTALNKLKEITSRGLRVCFMNSAVEVNAENFNRPDVLFSNFFGQYRANDEVKRKAGSVKADWQARIAAAKAGQKALNQNLPSWLRWQPDPVIRQKGVGKVEPIPERVLVVQLIFRLYLSGLSIRAICRRLRADKIPSISKRKNNGWNVNFVHGILSNRAVLGECMGQPKLWPQAVNETDFYRAADRLKKAKHFTAAKAKADLNLFTGLLFCAKCGQPINRMTFRRKNSERTCLICGGAIHGLSNCNCYTMPYGVFEKALLSFLGDADLVRPLLSNPEHKPSKLDELEGRLADAERQATKLAEFLFGDSDPSALVYNRQKQEEKRAVLLRQEIEQERARERAQKPALLAYNEFVASLPAIAKDQAKRRELRQAVGTVIQSIRLDPQANAKGQWTATITLKDASAQVEMFCVRKPEGWLFRSLQPEQYRNAMKTFYL
jgi:Recombinase/Recombinase zinc beta ribbon domain/Resolvase, N terminal domain